MKLKQIFACLGIFVSTIAYGKEGSRTVEVANCLRVVASDNEAAALASLKSTEGREISEMERKEYQAQARIEDSKTASRVQSRITSEQAHALGGLSFYEDGGWLQRCGQRRVGSIDLNMAANYLPIETGIDSSPFFKGQSFAQEKARNIKSGSIEATTICAQIYEDFGPKGLVFPGLVGR